MRWLTETLLIGNLEHNSYLLYRIKNVIVECTINCFHARVRTDEQTNADQQRRPDSKIVSYILTKILLMTSRNKQQNLRVKKSSRKLSR